MWHSNGALRSLLPPALRDVPPPRRLRPTVWLSLQRQLSLMCRCGWPVSTSSATISQRLLSTICVRCMQKYVSPFSLPLCSIGRTVQQAHNTPSRHPLGHNTPPPTAFSSQAIRSILDCTSDTSGAVATAARAVAERGIVEIIAALCRLERSAGFEERAIALLQVHIVLWDAWRGEHGI